MKKRFTALLLAAALVVSLCGCSEVVGDIAGNVAEVARQELENQIKEKFTEFKVTPVEIKSTVGRLNDDSDSDAQFFCGVLVRSNSDAIPQSICDALDGLFERSGMCRQTESAIRTELLTNKSLSFKHTDFSSGDYYLLWVYSSSLTKKLENIELPSLPAGLLPTAEPQSVG